MLRVGLTGGIGSGKSTVAKMLAERGAHVLASDAIGRELMQQGSHGVYDAIIARFGPEVVRADGELDRAVLAKIAFTDGRVEELNAIVHPAVIARQEELISKIGAEYPAAVIVVESALIFETKYAGGDGWRKRFDRILLVIAPESVRIERYAERIAGHESERDARLVQAREAEARMSHQIPDEQKIALSDYVIRNESSMDDLRVQVDALWPVLRSEAADHT